MKNKNLRGWIPIVAVVCLALLILFLIIRVPVYMDARNLIISSTGDDSPDWDLVMDVGSDFLLMNKTGGGAGYVSVDGMRVNEDGTITYISSKWNSESKIHKEADGNIVEEVWEEDIVDKNILYNKVIYSPSGEMLDMEGERIPMEE